MRRQLPACRGTVSSTRSKARRTQILGHSRLEEILIGSLLNLLFYGALVVQVYIYSACFHADSRILKCIVYLIFLAMTVCVALNCCDVHRWFATGFGDPSFLALPPGNAPFYGVVMSATIGTVVRCLFCARIFVIKRTAWPVALLLALFSVSQCALGVASGIHVYVSAPEQWQDRFNLLFPAWLAGSAIADILAALIMTYLLLSAAVHSSTRDRINRIVWLIIETNSLSAMVAILAVALFFSVPRTSCFEAAMWNLAGIYANTLLAVLNNRAISPRPASVDGGILDIAPSPCRWDIARVESVPEMTFARRQSVL
ncbi:hypothetical protein B0H15DRAFT_870523 [Mycena belliarum]|uniref:DUF6534 domain-containing protein n=1 Tax=Mycena belliarum TaxID=1033014 RepID=A0AAD6TS38_9AGAR|nr:hypothetical protein B0H15DRAFT_870523 [Mycena belliae]